MCSVEGCDRRGRNKNSVGLCEMHYYRLRRTGTLADPPRITGTCHIDGCDRASERLSGHCRLHYLRIVRRGDPDFTYDGENHWAWSGEMVTYNGAHLRVNSVRGRAADFCCTDCGSPAAHWSYSHSGVDEIIDPRGIPYSSDPDQYHPRCVPCHKRFDLAYV